MESIYIDLFSALSETNLQYEDSSTKNIVLMEQTCKPQNCNDFVPGQPTSVT